VQELVLQIKKSKLTFFFALEIKSEEKARKMENQLLVSPSRQCSSTPVGYVQGFLSKAQRYNTERPTNSPDLALTDFHILSCMKAAIDRTMHVGHY
jgi:hypothetical protein